MEKRYDRLEEIVIGVKKNIDNIEEVQKFNPHHDSKGRFASGKGGAGGGMSHAERDAKEKYGMTMQQMRDAVANDPEANKIASEMLNTQMNAGINHMTFDEVAVLAYTQVHGKKGANGDIQSRAKSTWAKLEPLEAEYNGLGKEWDVAREAWRKANKAKDSNGRSEAKQRMDAITDKMNKIEPKIKRLRNQWDKIEREAYEAGVTLA